MDDFCFSHCVHYRAEGLGDIRKRSKMLIIIAPLGQFPNKRCYLLKQYLTGPACRAYACFVRENLKVKLEFQSVMKHKRKWSWVYFTLILHIETYLLAPMIDFSPISSMSI